MAPHLFSLPRSRLSLQSSPPRASTSFGTRRPSKHPAGERPGCPGRAGPRRRDQHTIARRCLADHPHPLAFCTAAVICDPEGPESIDPCSARATVVRYRRREARVAGYRGRGTSAGRVDHACASSPWAGARRSAAEHPPRCHGSAVAQGVRAPGVINAAVSKVLAKRK